MKKTLLLLFVFLVVSASAHAALTGQVKLTVVSTQSGGTIIVFNKTSNTPGVTCSGTTPCTFTFRTGTNVAITANSASVGFALRAWTPARGSAATCLNQTAATCSFSITQDSSATAKFDQVFNLRVQVGTGSGTIRVKDNNVTVFDCTNTAPLSCSRGFFKGSAITIENIAGSNQQFGSYANKIGSMVACTANPCNFTLAADSALVSNFIQIP